MGGDVTWEYIAGETARLVTNMSHYQTVLRYLLIRDTRNFEMKSTLVTKGQEIQQNKPSLGDWMRVEDSRNARDHVIYW